MSTGCPTRISASCDSLKLAVTQISSGTTTMIDCPGAASAPTAAVSLVTRPSTVARNSVRCRSAVGAILLRLGLLELRRGADLLRVQHVDLPLGHDFRGVGCVQRGLLAGEIGRGLLRALNGAGAFLHQVLVADVFIGGEFERGLRLRHLLGGLLDLGLLGCDLGVDVFRRRFVLLDLPVGLVERRLVIARVDGREQIAFFHDLVVGDVDAGDAAGDFRADQHRPSIDKGIVGALVVTGMKIPGDAGNDADGDQTEAYDHRDRMLLECALDALRALLAGLDRCPALCGRFFDLLVWLRFLRNGHR